MIEQIDGFVQKVYFNSPQQDFCVFAITDDNDERITVTWRNQAPREGDDVTLRGAFIVHPKYGRQFQATSVEKRLPTTQVEALKYLERSHIKGLGPKTLEKISEHFPGTLSEILRESPERLLEVPKIKKSVQEALQQYLCGSGAVLEVGEFLENNGVSSKWARSLYTIYGSNTIEALRRDPYILLLLGEGATFQIADTLASNLGFSLDDDARMTAGIRTLLMRISEQGHTCLPIDEIILQATNLLGGFADEVVSILESMIANEELIMIESEGIQYIYPQELFEAEIKAAEYTLDIMGRAQESTFDIESFLEDYQAIYHINLGKEQKEAARKALSYKLSVITGGPGTGKTTVIKALVQAFQKNGKQHILLCAPTGRASRRLSEATNCEALTIHRMLVPINEAGDYCFERDEDNLLPAEVVIVDEASMLNIQLYEALVAAIPKSATLIIVGDVDQLPPIGAGFVLRDLLESKSVPYTKLSEIYRQQRGNRIVTNAHLINHGNMPNLECCAEFEFCEVNSHEELRKSIVDYYSNALENNADQLSVQIISPMRRGEVGSISLSKLIQSVFNPKHKEIAEIKINGNVYRVGDKVIQTANNYDDEIFNGEIGEIYAIADRTVFVRFPSKEISFSFDEMPQIMLAYAITVHKSQGSEYKEVIIPFISSYHVMLQRNLLYTAITRAKEKVVIVGSKKAITKAISTIDSEWRYTLFKERLQSIL